MKTLYIDFETYWDKDVSLKKLSTSEYITHPKFAVLCASAAIDDGPIEFLRPEEIAPYLARVGEQGIRACAHNMLFDGYILHLVYNYHPEQLACTMAMSYALLQGAVGASLEEVVTFLEAGHKLKMPNFKGKYAEDFDDQLWADMKEYNDADTIALRAVDKALNPSLTPNEHKVLDITLKMFCSPKLEIDLELAREALNDARQETKALVHATGRTAEEIRGNISFRNLLLEQGIEPPKKLSPKQDYEEIDAFAKTDEEFLALLDHENDQVRALVAARLAVKSTIGETRAERLLHMAEHGDHKLAVALNYGKAHTLRWTGGNKMNLQNFKKKSKLRKSIIAPPGYVLVVADASQIECRKLAWLAGQEDLLHTFRTKGDPYSEMASDVFGFQVRKAEHPDQRFVGKTAVLGLGFTMGADKFGISVKNQSVIQLGKQITLEPDFLQLIVSKYRQRNYKIVQYWEQIEHVMWSLALRDGPAYQVGILEVCPREKTIRFPNDMYLYYPQMEVDDEGKCRYWVKRGSKYIPKYVHRGLVVENIVQTAARHVIAHQIPIINERYPVVMTTHDELVTLVPEAEADEALAFIIETMRIPPPWAAGLPLDAEGGYDVCYSK